MLNSSLDNINKSMPKSNETDDELEIIPTSKYTGFAGEIKLPAPRAGITETETRARAIDLLMRYFLRDALLMVIDQARNEDPEERTYVRDSLSDFASEVGISISVLTRYLKGNTEPGIRKVFGILLLLPVKLQLEFIDLLRKELQLPKDTSVALFEIVPGVWIDLVKISKNELENILVTTSKSISNPSTKLSCVVMTIEIKISDMSHQQKTDLLLRVATLMEDVA